MRISLLELRRRRWRIVEMTNGNLDVFKKFDSAKSGAATVEVKGVNHDAGFGMPGLLRDRYGLFELIHILEESQELHGGRHTDLAS